MVELLAQSLDFLRQPFNVRCAALDWGERLPATHRGHPQGSAPWTGRTLLRWPSRHDAQVTLHDIQQRVQWKLPYARHRAPGCAAAAANTASAANACCFPETLARQLRARRQGLLHRPPSADPRWRHHPQQPQDRHRRHRRGVLERSLRPPQTGPRRLTIPAPCRQATGKTGHAVRGLTRAHAGGQAQLAVNAPIYRSIQASQGRPASQVRPAAPKAGARARAIAGGLTVFGDVRK